MAQDAANAKDCIAHGVERVLSAQTAVLHLMKTHLSSIMCAMCLVVGGTQAADYSSRPAVAPILGNHAPRPLERRLFFQTFDTCKVTTVKVEQEKIAVSYTGQWTTSSAAKTSETGKHSFTVLRHQSAAAEEWNALVQRFNEARDKSINLLIFIGDEFVVKDGVPNFTFPYDCFQIILPGELYSFPIGYRF